MCSPARRATEWGGMLERDVKSNEVTSETVQTGATNRNLIINILYFFFLSLSRSFERTSFTCTQAKYRIERTVRTVHEEPIHVLL